EAACARFSIAFSRLFPQLSRACARDRGDDGNRWKGMKIKSRRLKGAGLGSKRFSCAAHGPATRIARLLLDAGVGRGDRLQRVGGDAGVKLGNLSRLGDEALVSLLGEFGLDL